MCVSDTCIGLNLEKKTNRMMHSIKGNSSRKGMKGETVVILNDVDDVDV